MSADFAKLIEEARAPVLPADPPPGALDAMREGWTRAMFEARAKDAMAYVYRALREHLSKEAP